MASTTVGQGSSGKLLKLRFILAIFSGSFLLFLVQPMVARMALPRLGGAPAVWNSAMLVYQLLLLGGYGYAHWLGRFAPRAQGMIHLALLLAAAAMLPIGLIGSNPPASANIFLWVPWLLLVSIGPLFLAISAQAPLLQRWYAIADRGDPYPLYAASNLGSFAGLTAYPLLVEPLLPVAVQSIAWSIGYGLVLLLVATCVLTLPRSSVDAGPKEAASPPPALSDALWWIGLAAIPSALILSTTLFITTDIVAMPLLWVLPLGLYLLSFSVAFAADRRPAQIISAIAPVLLLAAAGGLFMHTSLWMFVMGTAILSLFGVSVALHSALFDRRPDPSHLTAFYLYLAVGGALGGIFGALIAPVLFDWTYEHPLLMVAAALALPAVSPAKPLARLWSGPNGRRIAAWGIAILLLVSLAGYGAFGLPGSRKGALIAASLIFAVGIIAIGNRILLAAAVATLMLSMGGWEKLALSAERGKMSRSFFGVYTVVSRNQGDARLLLHGTTIHGVQLQGTPEDERSPTSYYSPPSGIGLALTAAPALFGERARIDIVGLGTGTVACYARQGQQWTFYEIDPAVVDIARDPQRFTFLSRCLPGAAVKIGDARLTLEDSPPNSTDLLVVDAFSSDSIPIHLLTMEAFDTYRRKLSASGLLLVHISNRHLDLKPVVAAAASRGWTARVRHYTPTDGDIVRRQHTASLWVAMSPAPETIRKLEASNPAPWQELAARPGFKPWTDDYASVLPVLRSLH